MSVLRMIEAAFRLDARNAVGPISIELEPSEAASLMFASEREATIGARLAAALVKATTGTVLIGDFDPKVQPVQAKRLIGYVPANPPQAHFKRVEDYFGFRADLWEVEREAAIERGLAVLRRCADPDASFALAFAGALIRPCALLVLDQPALEYVRLAIDELRSGCAVLTTHATQRARDAAAHQLTAEYRETIAT